MVFSVSAARSRGIVVWHVIPTKGWILTLHQKMWSWSLWHQGVFGSSAWSVTIWLNLLKVATTWHAGTLIFLLCIKLCYNHSLEISFFISFFVKIKSQGACIVLSRHIFYQVIWHRVMMWWASIVWNLICLLELLINRGSQGSLTFSINDYHICILL